MSTKSKLIMELVDNYNKKFNAGVRTEFTLTPEDSGDVLSIEEYYVRCVTFGKTLGFADETLKEWFGEY